MDENIKIYLKNNTVFSMATCAEDKPYSAPCFYAYDEDSQCLIFSSEKHTQHIVNAIKNNQISGSIYTEVSEVAQIKGIQFTGTFVIPNEKEHYYGVYQKRFPFAKEMVAPIWAIQLNWIKMTDNTLGFGTKLEWESAI